MTSNNWSVRQRRPLRPLLLLLLAPRILSYFFFFFCSFFFLFTLSHTDKLVKCVAVRFSPSPTMQLTSRKQHLILQYVHTHVFLSNNIKEEQGKNDSHPEREKKTGKKKKEIQRFVPCCNPPQMEKRTDTEYKNITIFYIKLPLLALVQEYAHFSRELVSRGNLYF